MKIRTLIIPVLSMLSFLLFIQCSSEKNETQPRQQTVVEQLASEPGIIIDVRTPEEYQSGHLKEASYNYDLLSGEFEEKLAELDKDTTYYLYCRSGNRSGQAAELMKKNGFTKVYNLGGYQALVDKGLSKNDR